MTVPKLQMRSSSIMPIRIKDKDSENKIISLIKTAAESKTS